MLLWLLVLFCWLNYSTVLPEVQARQPSPAELEAIQKETKVVFLDFLQLWQEERYFELYNYGNQHSREQISIEEFATRMVELDWVPLGLHPEKRSEVSYHYRTFLYVIATIVFRHKSDFDLQFSRRQSFLLLKESGKWHFDLLQMIRSPFYSPPK
ncbi:MAG: hypothetical protein H8E38_12165 [SAR324 cluster bacterium]|nr:hypothetical protein [SAR324 cluster bacterium]MBL7035227.1 hypothetical protein [SAR324 cluster bacterium]